MAQRSRGERVLGPYPIGKQWRVVVVGRGGERDSHFYPSEEEARQVIRAIRREFARSGDKTVQEGLEAYERYLLDDKGNKPGSVEDTIYRLGAFFPDGEVLLRDLNAKTCSGYYDALRTRKTRLGRAFSVDSHRNILAEAKSFLRWCTVKKKWLARNPLEEVEGVGKRKHGKTQLRVDEARRRLAKAVEVEHGVSAQAVAVPRSMRNVGGFSDLGWGTIGASTAGRFQPRSADRRQRDGRRAGWWRRRRRELQPRTRWHGRHRALAGGKQDGENAT